ncbi:MAG: ABC transporter ATP-binding protein [Treponema sp.]|jgi:ABC-type nitrate/sulfonate/bicarbonate transport system ATPase subunit|nr:ABC transporter ATP-binding protein [Treponema sp.]
MSTFPETDPAGDNSPCLFRCEGITQKYQDETVVEGIRVELPAGGIISLLGPSGVGKTTLFNILAGVDRPSGGQVFLLGEDITGVSGRVSYMLQKDLLLEYRTVLDNVILPLLIKGKKKKEARSLAAEFFPQFGLSGYEKKYPRELSGGMRQRAALLRTCMMRNPVILLDEPFSALDAITRRQMQDWFCGIASAMGFSTLFITHDVEEALLLSDRVYVLTGKPGKITADFAIRPGRPRDHSFPVSPGFGEQKQLILEAIGL